MKLQKGTLIKSIRTKTYYLILNIHKETEEYITADYYNLSYKQSGTKGFFYYKRYEVIS